MVLDTQHPQSAAPPVPSPEQSSAPSSTSSAYGVKGNVPVAAAAPGVGQPVLAPVLLPGQVRQPLPGLLPGQTYDPRDFRQLIHPALQPINPQYHSGLPGFPIQSLAELDEVPTKRLNAVKASREEVGVTKEAKQAYPGFTKMEGFLPEHAIHSVIEDSVGIIHSNTIDMMDNEEKKKHAHVYSHEHSHAHKSDHSHGHKHGHDHKADHKHGHKHDHKISASHKHDHKHSSKHGHDHKHGHKHQADHKHDHKHSSSHGHDHKHEHKAGHKHLHQHKQDHTHGHTHKGEHKHHHVHEHHHHHHHKHSHASEHKHGHDHKHNHKGIY